MANYNSVEELMDNFDILVDLPFTLAKVKELQQIANNIEGTDKIIKNQIKRIEETWKGNSSAAMIERLSQANATNRMLVDELQDVARRIKTIVEGINDADMASVQRSQNIGK